MSLDFKIRPVMFLTTIFFIGFLSRIALAPLLPLLEGELNIGHAQAGALLFCISLGYSSGLFASSYVAAAITHRYTIVLSAIVSGIFLTMIPFIQSLWGLRIIFVLFGAAISLYLPSGIATLTSLVDQKYWGKAIAIHELAPNSSLVLAPLLVQAFLPFLAWRSLLALLGFVSLILGLMYLAFGEGGRFKGEPLNSKNLRYLLGLRSMGLMVIIMGLGVGASLGIYGMLPLYLITEIGLREGFANGLVGLSRITGIVLSFLSGAFSDRFGAKRALLLTFAFSASSTLLLGLTHGNLLVLCVFLQSMFAAAFFPPAFSVLSQIVPDNLRNLSVSLAVLSGTLMGGGAVPLLIGVIGDLRSLSFGFTTYGFLLFSALFLVSKLQLK